MGSKYIIGDLYVNDNKVVTEDILIDKGIIVKDSEGLSYTLSNDDTYYIVTGIGTCTDTDIKIPPLHEELPVTSIGENAFEECDSLTSVVIPDSVTSIGVYAFYDCSNLSSVVIPDSVTYIGEEAFWGCTSLTSVTIGNGVTSIDHGMFVSCISLTSITIPNSIINIGGEAFCNCDSLTSITIPNSVTSIGSSAFYNCDSLTSIVIPDSVSSIGNNAFSGCSSLTIYCEAAEQPSGWHAKWNGSNRPVVWSAALDIPSINDKIVNHETRITELENNSGGGSGSGGGIIDVEEFPSEPSTSAIYRKWQIKAEWLLGGEIVTDGGMTCEVVSTLPETGNMCYTGTAMYSYYQRADGEVYGYVNDILSQQMSVPVGWYPASTLFVALGYTYNGIVDSIDNASSDGYQLLVTKKPHLYSYYNDETEIKKSKIITSDDLDSSGGSSIIYATEKPSTPQQAIYVITEDEVVKAEVIMEDGSALTPEYAYIEIVDELPNDGHIFMYNSGVYEQALYGYYLTTDDKVYGYVDEALSTATELPVGWNNFITLGLIKLVHSTDEYDGNYEANTLVTTEPKTRVYVPLPDGTFLELTSGIRTRFDENSGTVSITEM